jgi:hypothetical protein
MALITGKSESCKALIKVPPKPGIPKKLSTSTAPVIKNGI